MTEELQSDSWYIAARPFRGAKSIMQNIGNLKNFSGIINGSPNFKLKLLVSCWLNGKGSKQ